MDTKRTKATKFVVAASIAVAATAVLLAYVGRPTAPGARQVADQASNTAVLGSNGMPAKPVAPVFPPPPAPRGAEVEIVGSGPGQAVAIWTQEGRVHAGRYATGAGWTDLRTIDDIPGETSDLELTGNGSRAMAVWRHTLGEIQSLRYAVWDEGKGWATADVVPGVLPRRLNSGVHPNLIMDGYGNVTLQWPSGFGGTSAQVTRFEAGRGWSQPLDVAAR